YFFFFQAEDGIRDYKVTGVQTCALPIYWFTRRERSRANTLLILGNPLTMLWASVLSGFLIAWFDSHPVGGYKGWQMMFILEGLRSEERRVGKECRSRWWWY